MTGMPLSFSPIEHTEAALERTCLVDDDIRSFVTTLPESARAEAQASEARMVAGQSFGPLDGIPFAVKDNIAVAGLPTRCGTLAPSAPAHKDATVVARLRAAGGVLLGTLNMHEGALGGTTDNPFWGRCMNPLKYGYTPGGSSGGSAAAIASGIVTVTLGTDTMGSVRIPAAYCGLWGLKPTKGRVPATGMTHLSWTLDTIGPLARDPGTLGAILSVIEGPDLADPLNTPLNAGQPHPTTLVGLRLGVPDVANLAACEDIVLVAFERFKLALTDAGVILTPINIKDWSPGKVRRAGLLISEVEGAEVLGNTLEGLGLSDDFRAMLLYGRSASAGQLALAYHKMQALAVSFDNAVVGLDGLLLPTAPQRAFAHDGAVPVNQADFTSLANMVGAPAITVPLCAPDGELPCAAQIVGQRGSDHSLIAMGEFLKDLSPVLRLT